jgi:hypothetical protein
MVDFSNIKGHDNEGQLKNNQKRGKWENSELSDEAKADAKKLKIIWSYLDMQDNALKECIGELITVILDDGLSKYVKDDIFTASEIDYIVYRIRNQITAIAMEGFKEDAE